ncbi:FkbM family methyltransferase [Candidatus Peregrinibacteria bacterium]|nr:FkbM family methyltransferase [Candidatus Peregrinibacteria bacterium]MBI3816144.1 FkbM family methyltransferase [Candidatus Peregrinibacteria bacterium]
MYILTKRPIGDITFFQRRLPFIERHEYSQNGEDGIIAAVFAMIGTTNRSCVEFGVEDGMESNTRHLIVKKGWKGLLMDGSHEVLERRVHREFITTENIEDLFRKYHVPKEFDLLSIDIDGNDYWIWKAITTYRPRVVIIEYNAHLPPEESKTIPYDPAFVWDTTDYYGASLLALRKLGEAKGYTLLGTDRNGVNAFFVESSLVPGHFDPLLWPQTYHPPAFKGKAGNRHPKDPRNRGWVDV